MVKNFPKFHTEFMLTKHKQMTEIGCTHSNKRNSTRIVTYAAEADNAYLNIN